MRAWQYVLVSLGVLVLLALTATVAYSIGARPRLVPTREAMTGVAGLGLQGMQALERQGIVTGYSISPPRVYLAPMSGDPLTVALFRIASNYSAMTPLRPGCTVYDAGSGRILARLNGDDTPVQMVGR